MVISRRRGMTDWMPIGGFVVALLLAFLALPSILRQSPPQQNQAAELSPDAPPDAEQSLISTLNRGSSATAGAGNASGGAGDAAGPGGNGAPGAAPAAAPPPAPAIPRYCPYGRGNPPRQTFNVYSPACAAAFQGDNGGATASGVTSTEFRVAVYNISRDEGPVDDTSQDSDMRRFFRDFETWFNTRYQFYGRSMRIYLVAEDLNSPASASAAAARAKSQYQVFAGFDELIANNSMTTSSIQQKIVTWTGYRANQFYAGAVPYAWSFGPATDRQTAIGGELVCKQLAGKPPTFNEQKDATFDYSKPRKFGALVVEWDGGTTNEDQLKAGLKPCGITPDPIVSYNFQQGAPNLTSVASQMKAAGVTTILDLAEQSGTGVVASEATQQSYFPEWVGYGNGLAINAFMQPADKQQWKHAIGIGLDEIPRPLPAQDWYRMILEVDPDAPAPDPSQNWVFWYGTLLQIANGVQLAGPHLTPETFAQGLHSAPSRAPDPSWSIGGGFQSPDPWTFNKYAGLIWWDPNAVDPSNGKQGAYRWLNNGKRYTSGEIPTDPLPFFKDGITSPPSG